MEQKSLHAMCRKRLYYVGEWDTERKVFIWRLRSNVPLFVEECQKCAGKCEWWTATEEIDFYQLSLF